VDAGVIMTYMTPVRLIGVIYVMITPSSTHVSVVIHYDDDSDMNHRHPLIVSVDEVSRYRTSFEQ